jgi:hypothetical protein
MLQTIQIPPTPMSAVVITVNTAAGSPMLIPFGPSQSAGTVRAIVCGGIVTFTEARQAAEYAGIGGQYNYRTDEDGVHAPLSTGVEPARGSGIFSFFLINSEYMPVILGLLTEWKRT